MNWAALKTAVGAWANRTDLTSLYTTMLQLAEQRIWYGDQVNRIVPLRHLSMLTTASVTMTSGVGTLPADFIDLERATITATNSTSKTVLEYRTPAQIAPYEGASGTSAYFSLRSGQIIVAPGDSSPVSLIYYAKAPSPVADADENWVMRDAPGLYLYGMLVEVGLYLRDDDLLNTARALYQNASASLQAAGDQRKAGGFAALTITRQ